MKKIREEILYDKEAHRDFRSHFMNDKVAILLSWFMTLLFIFSFLGYFFIPDKTQFANSVNPAIGNQPPGFEVKVLRIVKNRHAEPQHFFSKLIYGTVSNDVFLPVSSSHYEGTEIVVKEFSASGDSSFESRYSIADVVYPINSGNKIIERNGGLFFETNDGTPMEVSISDMQAIIDGQYLVQKKFKLGTDHLGRDVWSRLVIATRGTIWSAFAIAALALFFGFVFGAGTGMVKGKINLFLRWIIYSVSSIPALLLIIVAIIFAGNGFWNLCLVTGFVLGIQVARIVVFKILSTGGKKFVDSAKVLGLNKSQVLKNYIFPDVLRTLFATGATIFSAAVLIVSGLGFLGIGFKDPFPSWGMMIRENYGYIIIPGYQYLTIIPGLSILVVAVIFVVLANRIQSALKENHNWSLV